MKIETITPDLAREWLALNTHNRPVKNAVVKRYASDIKDGQWEVNGESVKFSVDKVLLDGQHRLLAVLEAGKPIETYVIRGLPAKVFDTLDTGAKRVVGDLLSLEGHAYPKALGTALRYLYVHDELGSARELSSKYVNLVTNRDLMNTLIRHPDIDKSLSYTGGLTGLSVFLSHPLASYCHYLFARCDQHFADDFFLKLAKGAGLEDGHPILVLRSRLMNMHRASREGRIEAIAITIKAWNAYRRKKPVKQLRWSAVEDYPVAA